MLHTTSTTEVPIRSHLLLIVAILVASFLMFWLSGGFPPNTWRILLQILPQIKTLWSQRGPAIFFPLLILSVQSLLLAIAWLGILWAAVREISALVTTFSLPQPLSRIDTVNIAQSSQTPSLLPGNTSQSSQVARSFPASNRGTLHSVQRKTPSIPIVQPPTPPAYVLPRMNDEVVQQPLDSADADTVENPFEDHVKMFKISPQPFTSSHKSQVLAPSFALENPFAAQEDVRTLRPLNDIDDPNRTEERKKASLTAPLKPLDTGSLAANPFLASTPSSTLPDEDTVYVFGNPFETQNTLPPAVPLSAQKTAPLLSSPPTQNVASLSLPLPTQKTPSSQLAIAKVQPDVPKTPPVLEQPAVHTPSAFDTLLGGSRETSLTSTASSPSQLKKQEPSPAIERVLPSPVTVKDTPHRASAMTHTGIKRANKPNEDAYHVTTIVRTLGSGAKQPVSLFLIADGMGGHRGGEYASSLVIETIRAEIEPLLTNPNSSDTELKTSFVNAVHHANTRLYQDNDTAETFRGTTLTGAILIGQALPIDAENNTIAASAHVVNVGDSRTYQYSASQGLSRITHDHSIVEQFVSQGFITDEERYTDSRRNEIYRCLGEKQTIEVDVFTVSLQPCDRLLLCSDGLWEMVRDPALETLLSVPLNDPSLIASILLQAALEGGGKDNITLIVALLPD